MFVTKIQSYKDNVFKACPNLDFFPWVIEFSGPWVFSKFWKKGRVIHKVDLYVLMEVHHRGWGSAATLSKAEVPGSSFSDSGFETVYSRNLVPIPVPRRSIAWFT